MCVCAEAYVCECACVSACMRIYVLVVEAPLINVGLTVEVHQYIELSMHRIAIIDVTTFIVNIISNYRYIESQ